MWHVSFLDELVKQAVLDDVGAKRSLERYESLEKATPTIKEIGRYSALGAVSGPTISAVGDIIKGEKPFGAGLGLNKKQIARRILSDSFKGAVGSGAIPLIRHQLDRGAELRELREYLRSKDPGFGKIVTASLGMPKPPAVKGMPGIVSNKTTYMLGGIQAPKAMTPLGRDNAAGRIMRPDPMGRPDTNLPGTTINKLTANKNPLGSIKGMPHPPPVPGVKTTTGNPMKGL